MSHDPSGHFLPGLWNMTCGFIDEVHLRSADFPWPCLFSYEQTLLYIIVWSAILNGNPYDYVDISIYI